MSYWLLVISIVGVLISYLMLLVSKLMNNKRALEDSGFDIAKEVTSNYEEINIVSSNDIMASEYDIKRNVIRLNNKTYNGNSYYDGAVASLLAGYSLVKSENNNYFKFSFIFKRVRVLSLVSLVMLILSYFVNNIGDAKIGIVLFLILLVYQYMRYQIVVLANNYIRDNLKEEVYANIKGVIDSYISFSKLSFVVSMIMIVRLVVIILGI